MKVCPSCRQEVGDDAPLCAQCGAAIPTVWPPPPTGTPPTITPPRLLTGTRGGDIALGIVAGVLSPVVWSVASLLLARLFFLLPFLGLLAWIGRYGLFFVGTLGLYLWARSRYPVFARSLGWTFLAEIALALGAVVWCFASLSHG